MKTDSLHTADRLPLEVAEAIAARFMKIPRKALDYMYSVGLRGILDLYEATKEQKYLDCYLTYYGDKPRFDYGLYEATGDSRWLTGAQEEGEKFLANPRRDSEGSLQDFSQSPSCSDMSSRISATSTMPSANLKSTRPTPKIH